MPESKKKEDDATKISWVDALAAAISGFAGTDYAAQLNERIENEKRRREREEEDRVEKDRYDRQEARLTERDIAEIYEGLGVVEAGRKRVSEPIPMDGVSSPDTVMTGIPSVDAALQAVDPSLRMRTAVSGRGRGMAESAQRIREREEDIEARIEAIPAEERARADAYVDTIDERAAAEFDAGAEQRAYEAAEWERRFGIELANRPPSGGLTMSQVRDLMIEQLEGPAYDEASQLTSDPHMTLSRATQLLKENLREHARVSGLAVSEADISSVASRAAATHFNSRGPKGTLTESDMDNTRRVIVEGMRQAGIGVRVQR